MITPFTLAAITDLLCRGVVTDGGHHKQWFLEEIAAYLEVDLPDHEKGIPA